MTWLVTKSVNQNGYLFSRLLCLTGLDGKGEIPGEEEVGLAYRGVVTGSGTG